MTTPQLKRLTTRYISGYGCTTWPRSLSTVLKQAAKKDVSYADFLNDMLARQVAAKQKKHQPIRVMMARFPFQKVAGELRLEVPAVDRAEGDQGARP